VRSIPARTLITELIGDLVNAGLCISFVLLAARCPGYANRPDDLVADGVPVERRGGRYAIEIGPYHARLRFCEAALAGEVATTTD
jgi:hypothetical protein